MALFLVLGWRFPPLVVRQPPLVLALCCKFLCHFFVVARLPILVRFSLQFLKTFVNCFKDSIYADSVLMKLAVTGSINLLEDSKTVSSGDKIG